MHGYPPALPRPAAPAQPPAAQPSSAGYEAGYEEGRERAVGGQQHGLTPRVERNAVHLRAGGRLFLVIGHVGIVAPVRSHTLFHMG